MLPAILLVEMAWTSFLNAPLFPPEGEADAGRKAKSKS